ncbi:MAG: shufflon system plasmid conjugative transfer pilus tip adhesin PilV [Aeromonas popoffii]|uniref:shufflon system plasmid conjugative transfer pilus tip adhesin PilV n=1 Tax=Aeromonas popoffii TaxID=70856 RepID=UPI003F38260C
MDKINVNAIDASMATEGATDYLLGVDASGEVKKTNISALDTYSRAEIDAKNAEDKQYADLQVSALIGGATPENLNTLSELAAALEKEGDAIVAINNELGTKYSPSNKPTPADIGALPVSHVPLYVGAADKRQVIPSQVGGNRVEPLFVSNLTLGVGDPNSYSDLVVMNTYTDPTGGFMNALAFDKTSKAIYHFQSDMNGTEWGVASVVYTSANPPTLAGMKALGYGNWATDADTLRNGSGFTYGTNAPYAGPILDVGTDSGSYSLQLNARYGNGQDLAFRVHNGDTSLWNPWFNIYHQGNKPTPDELGALPISNPVANGAVTASDFITANGPTLRSPTTGDVWIINKSYSDKTHKGIGVDDNGPKYWTGTENSRIWHNGNAPETATRWPSATEVGALPLSGGNINGPLAASGVIRSDAQVRGFGTGNTFGSAGLETGATTGEPSISFHKEGAYAATLRMTASGQFGFLNQDNSAYCSLAVANLTATNNISATGYIRTTAVNYGGEFRGTNNVAGTGEAIHCPAGVYSLGHNWLYGPIETAGHPIACGDITARGRIDTDNITTGDITSSSWLRTTGDGGWFSTTHGGGLHMLENVWLRVYGGKKFYVANTEHDSIQTSGGIAASGNLQCNAIAAAGRITTSEGFSGNGSGLTNIPYSAIANQWVNIIKTGPTACVNSVPLPAAVLSHLAAGGTVGFRLFQNQSNTAAGNRLAREFLVDGSDGWQGAHQNVEQNWDWPNVSYTRLYTSAFGEAAKRNNIWSQYNNIARVDYRLL